MKTKKIGAYIHNGGPSPEALEVIRALTTEILESAADQATMQKALEVPFALAQHTHAPDVTISGSHFGDREG